MENVRPRSKNTWKTYGQDNKEKPEVTTQINIETQEQVKDKE